MGRDSSEVIVTRYVLDGQEIETRSGRYFPHLSRPSLGPHSSSYAMGTGYFSSVKRPEHGVDHQTPPSAEVKERVQLYIYSPSGPFWPVLERTLPLLRSIYIVEICSSPL